MHKGIFTAILFALGIASQANAWGAEENTSLPSNEDSFKRHTISVGYGILTLSDFVGLIGSAIISIFGEDDSFGTLGAISVDYGYKVNEMFETGLVFNFAMPLKDEYLYTIMPGQS